MIFVIGVTGRSRSLQHLSRDGRSEFPQGDGLGRYPVHQAPRQLDIGLRFQKPCQHRSDRVTGFDRHLQGNFRQRVEPSLQSVFQPLHLLRITDGQAGENRQGVRGVRWRHIVQGCIEQGSILGELAGDEMFAEDVRLHAFQPGAARIEAMEQQGDLAQNVSRLPVEPSGLSNPVRDFALAVEGAAEGGERGGLGDRPRRQSAGSIPFPGLFLPVDGEIEKFVGALQPAAVESGQRRHLDE